MVGIKRLNFDGSIFGTKDTFPLKFPKYLGGINFFK